jgi:hypothetical protein
MKYAIDNYRDLTQPKAYLGGWVNEDIAYLDVSFNFQSLDEALEVAERANHIAIYDVVNCVSIYVKEARNARSIKT